jgi:hypothetical protein
VCLLTIHLLLLELTPAAPLAGFSANGIVSKSYGSWGHSYRMRPVTTLACGSTNTANLLVNTTLPTAFATCPPNCYDAGGDAYGYLNYRSNSRVCLAAQHAGVITGNGGMVIVRYVKGLSSYTGWCGACRAGWCVLSITPRCVLHHHSVFSHCRQAGQLHHYQASGRKPSRIQVPLTCLHILPTHASRHQLC